MRVLRSRVVMSTVIPKASQPPASEDVVVEPKTQSNVVVGPETPSKTSEFLTQSSNSTTPCSSSPGHLNSGLGGGGGAGSFVVSGTGTLLRRSARLATKLGISEDLESAEVVSRKRKKVEYSFNGEFDAGNLDINLGFENLDGIHEVSITGGTLQKLGDGGVSELVTNGEGVKDVGSATKLGLGYDIEISGVENLSNGRCKRKFSVEVKSLGLESFEKDETEKRFLSLRSGKKVVKREMKEDSGCAGNLLEGIENSEKNGTVFSRDVFLQTRSGASMKEDENGSPTCNRFSRGEKGKGKAGCDTLVTSGNDSVKSEAEDRIGLSLGDSNSDAIKLPKSEDLEQAVQGKNSIIIGTGVRTRGRLSKEEKGKMKLGVKDSSSNGIHSAEHEIETVNGSSVSSTINSAANEALQDGVRMGETDVAANDARRNYRERFRNVARRNASRFAHFSSQEETENRAPDVAEREVTLREAGSGVEDWPGPFSTAMKIIKDRETNKNGEQHGASTCKRETVELKWIPKEQDSCKCQKQVPSLQELCLSILSKNANAITSLDFVPDVLRHKISWFLCDSRRMDGHFLELLVHGSPTEIRVRDCSWLSEELFTKIFQVSNINNLTVFQFDQCGSCMPDYTLYATLARSPNSLPALTTISLKGAYRLSDAGLSMLVTAAPSLKSIDISQCPLLTSEGICCLAKSLRLVLRELYLDNCQGIDAMLILPALLRLENLEVLSVAGIETVCDDFVSEFATVHGCRMKELVLADCMELTDSSLEVVGDTCSELRAIDLSNLSKLTDVSIGHLANGCGAIQTLKFCRNGFSDEAIAAHLDVRGAFLKDLSLNNVIQVSNHTALSLARNCRNLRSLDLSWCRNLTNEALGMIVDSCSLLEVLKLFGCTQVTNVFVDGHSNPQVKVIGLKMSPLLKHIDVPDFLPGPLRYSSASS